MRLPIRLPELTPEALLELDELYRTTRDVRIRTRAQMILLAAEQHLVAGEIAKIVRSDPETVIAWLKRYVAEGIEGLADRPRSGGPAKVTPAYREQLLRVVRQWLVAAWASRTRCGPCNASLTTWPSRPDCGSKPRRCAST